MEIIINYDSTSIYHSKIQVFGFCALEKINPFSLPRKDNVGVTYPVTGGSYPLPPAKGISLRKLSNFEVFI